VIARSGGENPLRIALIAAFPFPLPQGSQIFVRDQAIALERAGARVTLFCYGRGNGDDPPGLSIVRTPRALSPRRQRSGPSASKPFADLAIAATFARACWRAPFDVALAHNSEAALAALAARPFCRVPVVYVAHTLMGVELETFVPGALRPLAEAAGRHLDRHLAAACDGAISLSQEAHRTLAAATRGPLALIPPGFDPNPAPSPARIAAACARYGLEPGGFVLYAGNLDPYQGLDRIAVAAKHLPDVPFIVATHAARPGPQNLRTLRLQHREEGRELTFGAGVCVLPRRAPGGFPIKLLNYMEAARPIVAHPLVAEGLIHDRSAWLLAADSDGQALAAALRMLLSDRSRAARLGAEARRSLALRHGWTDLARKTLEFASSVADQAIGSGRRRGKTSNAFDGPASHTEAMVEPVATSER
jgi:glycosyltransferase involved in cell wall biosynthesis